MIRDGIRDGSLRASDAHVATYAILLQCTGVALWFDPRRAADARAGGRAPRRAGARLAAGIAGADRRGHRERLAARGRDGGGVGRRVPDQAAGAPRTGDDRGRRAGEPAADALGDRAGDRVLRGPRTPGGLRAQPPQGARLPGGDRRASAPPTCSGRSASPGIDMVHTLCGGYGTARLHDRIDWERAGRAAHRLRLQRHHRPAPRARRPRGLGLVLRAELPALHAAEG